MKELSTVATERTAGNAAEVGSGRDAPIRHSSGLRPDWSGLALGRGLKGFHVTPEWQEGLTLSMPGFPSMFPALHLSGSENLPTR